MGVGWRRRQSTLWRAALTAVLAGFGWAWTASAFAQPYFATGIRIGEVTESEAVIWARLTRDAERVGFGAPLPEVLYRNSDSAELVPDPGGHPDWTPLVRYPAGTDIDTIEGSVPGAAGEVRIRYKAHDSENWTTTAWNSVDPERDHASQIRLTELVSDTLYDLMVESRSPIGGGPGATIYGYFRTAPAADADARILFMVSTGQAYPDQDMPGGGFKIYPQMLKLDPHFFVHTGDIVYYDRLAKTIDLARWHWARTYSLPTNTDFHRQVASYFIKDDHDTWMNDCWPGMESRFMGEFTFGQGQAVFLEQVPMGERTWRTFRWGKDLQIWLVEGRDFRSPNTMPDGPGKTIWGAEQMSWFKRTVQESDATFRVLISPTPVVGPDRTNKRDNHANPAFAHEGRRLREFIASQNNMVIICGDRHWQYVSVDNETGVREYSCGPASDEHAGGWSNDQFTNQHKYLNVVGGFLAVEVERTGGIPTLTARHYSVNGEVLNKDRLEAR